MSFACLPLVAAWSYNLGLGPTDYLRLKPEDQAHHCDQMNILRPQIRKTKIRNAFHFPIGRKRATWVSMAGCDCSWESTENCQRAQRYAGFVVWHLALCVSTSGSIDRLTILHAAAVVRQNFRKALFLEQGTIGDDKDFSGKVCVKWKDSEFERQVRSESLNPLSSRRCKQPSATVARRRGSSPRATEKSTNTPRKCWFFA